MDDESIGEVLWGGAGAFFGGGRRRKHGPAMLGGSWGSNVSPPPSWHCSYLGKEDPMPSGTIMFMLLSPAG